MPAVSRRVFVAASSTALLTPAATAAASTMLARIEGGPGASFPAQDPHLVNEVVGKSHADFDTVHELVTRRPALAKAAWDWGFGDWESALGAASHMGRRDIAELLIGHGARPNLFTFAMLGQVDVVRATCEANPGIQRTLGPHGITLLRHARAGREDATSVVEYLRALGDADVGQRSAPLDEATAQHYIGRYEPTAPAGVVLAIGFHARRHALTLKHNDGTPRVLANLGDHVFAPFGAESVRVTFDLAEKPARGLSIRDGNLALDASRLPV